MPYGKTMLFLCALWFPFAAGAQNLNEDLWAAARKGDADAVKGTLAKGAEVNAKTRYGATALSFAADRGHVAVIRILLENGADVNSKDTFYNAPAMTWAAYNGHTEAVKVIRKLPAKGDAPRIHARCGASLASAAQRLEHRRLPDLVRVRELRRHLRPHRHRDLRPGHRQPDRGV